MNGVKEFVETLCKKLEAIEMSDRNEMKYLEQIFEEYKKGAKKIRKLLEQGTEKLEIGDIVAIYGEDIVYGLVFEKIGEMYNVIFLTTELVLGGAGYKIEIDHMVRSLKVTPINFYISPKYCEVVGRVKKDEFEKILDNFKKMANRYKGIWKKFYNFEINRIKIFYDAFLSSMINYEEHSENEDDEKIIDLSKFFKKEELEKLLPSIAAASTSDKYENIIIEVSDGFANLYLPDELIGKEAELYLSGKLIYTGKLPGTVKFAVGHNFPSALLKEKLQIKLKEG
ncbi:hypothetical protein Ferpe_1542 [Fervidobacterium pennivorans DSM 9078]|uniref:Uncharacterized protein n=2 Tax=Fervidobacterium pennivorans TaxID=93466 RepID=H9UDL6_FERPD|nr:hypothetical protein Ferpe_1542 [Fervidobacterium pennivorans DSM 9078]